MWGSQHFVPAAIAAGTNGLRYLACEYVNQYASWRQNRDFSFDRRRGFSFLIFGAGYAGGPGYLIYNILYPRSRMFARLGPLSASIFDCCVHTPLGFFPIYYASKHMIFFDHQKFLSDSRVSAVGESRTSAVVGDTLGCSLSLDPRFGVCQSPSTYGGSNCVDRSYVESNPVHGPCSVFVGIASGSVSPAEGLARLRFVGRGAFREWAVNFKRDFIAGTIVWVPIMYVNFRFVPLQYRWPYMSVTGIVWALIFTQMQS